MKKIICLILVAILVVAIGGIVYHKTVHPETESAIPQKEPVQTPDAEIPEPKKDEEVVAPTPVEEEKPDGEITEIPLDSVKGITPEEAEKLCYNALGEKDEETGFIFSFGTAGAVETGGTQYYVIRASWLVNNSHLSYIGDFFVSADGRTIYSGTALAGEYTMDNIIWEK